MIRKIIKIDQEKCNGCGLCVKACHEGAIDLIDGKANLTRENYCDGLGDCLPNCPTGAISFEYREAAAYDEQAVLESKKTTKVFSFENKNNWPIQIKLAPINSPFYSNELVVGADCTAFVYPKFHQDFVKGKTVLIGCSKLDDIDYSEKLSQIISNNTISNIVVVKMEVPCCTGLQRMVQKAVELSNKNIEINVKTITTEGRIING